MHRANLPLFLLRLCLGLALVMTGAILFGPLTSLPSKLGVTKLESHALAFFVITALSLLAMPRMRKWDLALICLALGGLSELIQPYLGRDCEALNGWSDALGVGLAVGPMMLEPLRALMRHERRPTERRISRRKSLRAIVKNSLRP